MRKLTSHICLILCFSAFLLNGCKFIPLSIPTAEPAVTPTAPAEPKVTPAATLEAPVSEGPYAPVIVQHTPYAGQEVSLAAEIALHFDQPMDRASVGDAFRLYPPTDGDLVWRDDTTVVFRPKALASATRYRVALSPEARASSGLPLSTELTFAFSTVSPLEVTQISPQDMSRDARADAPVFIAFNRVVVPVSCVGQLAQADCPALPLTFSPAVLGDGLWVNTSLYRFDSLSGWAAGVTYQMSLDAGVRSMDGAELPAAVVTSFTTALPFILDTLPARGVSNIPLAAALRVIFNTPMDQEITASVFSVRTASGEIVPGTVTWEDGGARLLFMPIQQLALATRYIVQVGARARAVTSAPLQNPQSWAFETVPYPSVRAFTPKPDAKMDIHAPIRIAFAGEIDVHTLAAHLTIEPSPDTAQLYTYFEEFTRVYHVSWNKQPRTEYCITVEPGIADVYGNELLEAQTACFTTGDYDAFIGPAANMNSVTLDANSEPTFYLVLRNLPRVKFTLFALDETTFVNSPRNVTGEVVREWTERFTAPLNQATVEPLVLTRRGTPLSPGYYHLAWETPYWGTRGVNIAVIDRHITLKLAPEEALVWVTDLQTGVPISRTAVRLVDQDGVLIAAGTTNAEGIANIPVSQRDNLWENVAAMVGEPGLDGFGVAMTGWTAAETARLDIATGAFDIDVDYGPFTSFNLFLHTDRPLYHPGQIVNFSGVCYMRAAHSVDYTLPPADMALLFSLRDALGDVVYSHTFSLTEWGTFDGAILLSDDAPIGEYILAAELTGQAQTSPPLQSVNFDVTAYRKPEFEVTVTPELEHYVAGASLRALITADYLSGEAVGDAQVQWVVRAALADAVLAYQDPPTAPPLYGGHVIAEGVAATDAAGQFLLELPATLAEGVGSENDVQRWAIEATVVDAAGLTLTGVGTTFVHTALMAVEVHPAYRAVSAKTKVPVTVQVWDWQREPVSAQPVTVMLATRVWYAVKSESQFTASSGSLATSWAYTDTVVFTDAVETDATGQVEISVKPTAGGNYVLLVETTDAEGHIARSEAELWVSSDDAVLGPQVGNRLMPIADAAHYQVGATANILLPTPFTGPYQVLMTVERDGILDFARFDFATPNPWIEVPIVDTYAPNVYVSFIALQAVTDTAPIPDVRAGYVTLLVEPPAPGLTVELLPDKASYEPGDAAVLTVSTLDAAGAPVDAEVSLVVVDQALLALRHSHGRTAAPTLWDTFYGAYPLRVVLGDSLLVLLNRLVHPAQLEMLTAAADHCVAEAVLGGGGEVLDLSDVRREFPDTVLWETHLRTGETGTTQIELLLPDSLTPWVAQASAVTEHTQVGAAQAELWVQKPLWVRPVTPRFFVVGDRPQVAAVVHNHTRADLEVTVEVRVEGAGVLGEPTQVVAVPAGKYARVAWTLAIPSVVRDTIALSFAVAGGEYQDVTPATFGNPSGGIPLYRYQPQHGSRGAATPDVIGTTGVLDTAGNSAVALYIPSDAGAGSALFVQVDTSLLAALSAGLDYLAQYPYATTDALINRFLPNLITYRALQREQNGAMETTASAATQAVVVDSLARLYARQNPDGGWGWWPDWSNMHVTAYAVLGMVQARESGFEVREDVLARALFYVQNTLRLSLQGAARRAHHTFALYALSEARYAWPDGAADALYTARDSLDVTGRAYLALALGRVDASDTRIATLLDSLREEALITVAGAHWEVAMAQYWGTDIQATAVVVDALAKYAPADVLLPQAVRWLMSTRQANHWPTTYETAWSVMALANYAQTAEMTADYTWAATLNGMPLADATDAPWSVAIPLDEPGTNPLFQEARNVLEITRTAGAGSLYYAAHLALATPVDEIGAESRGLLVRREYCVPTVLSDARPDVCVPVQRVAVGDILEVRLTLVAPQMRHFVTLEDTYPAGFAPVRQRSDALPVEPLTLFNSSVAEVASQRVVWWRDPFDQRELRAERATFFVRELLAGTYQVRYTLRATFPGVYHALPTTAQETYFPEVWGRSNGAVIEVLD